MPITTTDASVGKRRRFALGSLRYPLGRPMWSCPHIVSFSGGRSSAALAFMAAEEGLLLPERATWCCSPTRRRNIRHL